MEATVDNGCDRSRPADEQKYDRKDRNDKHTYDHHREWRPRFGNSYRREEHHPWHNTPNAGRKHHSPESRNKKTRCRTTTVTTSLTNCLSHSNLTRRLKQTPRMIRRPLTSPRRLTLSLLRHNPTRTRRLTQLRSLRSQVPWERSIALRVGREILRSTIIVSGVDHD